MRHKAYFNLKPEYYLLLFVVSKHNLTCNNVLQVIVWGVSNGEALTVIDCHPDIIYSMSFNRDGSRLATTCKDKKLRIIDPRTGFVISVSDFAVEYIFK